MTSLASPIQGVRPTDISELLAAHSTAAEEFGTRATAIPPDKWNVARAPGKWTPAQEAKHLALGYGVFVSTLRGGASFRLKGRWWQRRLWRWFVLRRILATGKIHTAARAPRESRPPEQPGDKGTLIAEFYRAVADFETAVRDAHHSEPGRHVSHPYFNTVTLTELVRFCTIHIRHHAAFLPGPHPDRAG